MLRCCCLILMLAWGSPLSAADWPQWLGPNRDGSSSESISPWREAPKIVWRRPVGEGNSSPVVADGRVFVHSKITDKNEEEVVCFDSATGKLVWRASYARSAFKSLYGNGPRATPAVTNDKIYTFGITGLLTCFEAPTGRQVWQCDTLKQFNAANLFFGMACSPLIEGNQVLVNVGAKGASIVAFDKDTGKPLWKSLDDRASYSSPISFTNHDANHPQIVFLTQQGLVSLDPAGHLNWRFPLVDQLLESSSTPVRVGDVLMASSITYGSVGLQLTVQDGKPAASQLWKNESLTCYFSTPVAVGNDFIYVVTGTKPPALSNQATLHCIEAKTGVERWKRPKVGKYHTALLRTGNNKLLMLEEAGNVVLLEPDPKAYRELARAKVSGETWAHPALANGKLYIRDQKQLICVQLPASGS